MKLRWFVSWLVKGCLHNVNRTFKYSYVLQIKKMLVYWHGLFQNIVNKWRVSYAALLSRIFMIFGFFHSQLVFKPAFSSDDDRRESRSRRSRNISQFVSSLWLICLQTSVVRLDIYYTTWSMLGLRKKPRIQDFSEKMAANETVFITTRVIQSFYTTISILNI